MRLLEAEDPDLERRRQQILEGIERGEKAFREGRTYTHEQAKKLMAKWLKATSFEDPQ